MRGPPGRPWSWVLAAAAVVLLVLLAWWTRGADDGDGGRSDGADAPLAGEGDPLQADLYFPGTAGLLVVEERELPRRAEPPAADSRARGTELVTGLVTELVTALLAGPQRTDALAPLPEGVSLAGVHVDAAGVVYLDLVEADGAPPPPSGSLGEMLTVYSLVDTVLLNVPRARAVVVLWNGQQRESFAGHLDTSAPLVANLDLVAE